MASEMNEAMHYMTDYSAKVQPHLTSLFELLGNGQRRLEEQFRDDPDLAARGPALRPHPPAPTGHRQGPQRNDRKRAP